MRTEVKLGTQLQLDPQFSFLGLGSCFVNNIAPFLLSYATRGTVNPLGTTFNPISIADQLQWLLDDSFELPPLVKYRDEFHALEGSYSFRNRDETKLKEQLFQARADAKLSLQGKEVVVLITFGTAHAWTHQGRIVNNCHKLPQQEFVRVLLTVEEIVERWKSIVALLPKNFTLIFTLSPVRYTRVGLVENTLSKAILRLAIEQLSTLIPRSQYFPSFEIINDELRDYAYFKENGTHPNDQSIAVVWERLSQYLGLSKR